MFFRELDEVLNHENMRKLISAYLISDEDFIANLDNTVTHGRLKDSPDEERLDIIEVLCFGNTNREYILKMWILEHLLKQMKNEWNHSPQDPDWNKTLQKEWERCKQGANK